VQNADEVQVTVLGPPWRPLGVGIVGSVDHSDPFHLKMSLVQEEVRTPPIAMQNPDVGHETLPICALIAPGGFGGDASDQLDPFQRSAITTPEPTTPGSPLEYPTAIQNVPEPHETLFSAVIAPASAGLGTGC
jgi:hypothetical protein